MYIQILKIEFKELKYLISHNIALLKTPASRATRFCSENAAFSNEVEHIFKDLINNGNPIHWTFFFMFSIPQ